MSTSGAFFIKADQKLPSPPAENFTPEAQRRFKHNIFKLIGYEPDPWQALFHDSTARNRILPCGTRVGKTFCLAPETVAATVGPSIKSLQQGEYVGSRVWVVAPTYDTADKLFLPVARTLKRHFSMFITSYSERERIVRLLGGGYVQAKSADNTDSLISEELDAAIVDEAPRVGEHEKEMVKQRLATRDGWFAAIGSPVPCKWFQRDFALGQGAGYRYEWEGEPQPGAYYAGRAVRFVRGTGEVHPDYFSLNVPTHANPRIKRDFLLDLERSSDRIFRQDVLAEFMSTDGQVFTSFEHLAVTKRLPTGTPGRRYVVGWDVARARDFSVLSVMDYESKEQVFLDRFQGGWESQYEKVERTCRRFNRPDLVIDATGKGDPVHSEMRRRNNEAAARAMNPKTETDKLGAFAQLVEAFEINTNARKRDVVENLAMGFDQGMLKILPDGTQLQELRLYEYRQSDSTGIVRYGAPPGFHDDTVMALAMAWWRCSRPMGTADFLMG